MADATEDEERWADAEELLARWRPEPVERGRARDRRDDQLFVAATVLVGAAVALALALLGVDPSPDPGGEPTAWRAVTGLVVACVGLLFLLASAALRVPRRRPPMAWGSPLRELTARQRRQLMRQVRGRSPVEPERVGLARQTAAELLARRGSAVIQTGFTVAFIGFWMGDRSLGRTLLTLLFLVAFTVVAVQAWRDGRSARRFLEQYPYPED